MKKIVKILDNLVDTCPAYSCENRCLSNVTLTDKLSYEINNVPSRCDYNCIKYSDCCLDYIIYCLPKSIRPKSIKTPIKELNYFQKAAILDEVKKSTYINGSLPEKV